MTDLRADLKKIEEHQKLISAAAITLSIAGALLGMLKMYYEFKKDEYRDKMKESEWAQ